MQEIELDRERLKMLQKHIFDIATKKGWHDKPLSREHYLCLVMTEVAEAVEADREGRRAKTDMMEDVIRTQAEGEIGLTPQWYETWFTTYYDEYIKKSIEEEFADIVIRLLDMAQEIHGDVMTWVCNYPCGERYLESRSFPENAWVLTHDVLNWGRMNIADGVAFMYDWAQHLGIDLDKHIEWKSKKNEFRPYKHGGKKY